ncbi:MAG TPA: PEGA domain-containing protein [Planctomycetes bacterium]|nr:PEGA domain-containing protein [Planctomycetota bacterium]
MHRAHTIALLGFLLLSACRSTTPAGAVLATDPPGATVILGGKRTDAVTPCQIKLSAGKRYRVRLELPGYAPREILLVPNSRTRTVTWSEGAIADSGDDWALGLGAEDLFLPFERNRAHSPNRIFLRLEPLPSE